MVALHLEVSMERYDSKVWNALDTLGMSVKSITPCVIMDKEGTVNMAWYIHYTLALFKMTSHLEIHWSGMAKQV